MLLANHGALTLGTDLFSAYYKMETIEHFAKISLVARLLGGERLLSREEVVRLQGLRGRYGIAAPAPICAGSGAGGAAGRLPGGAGAVGARPASGAGIRGVSRRSGGLSRAARPRRERPCRPGNSANIPGTHGTD